MMFLHWVRVSFGPNTPRFALVNRTSSSSLKKHLVRPEPLVYGKKNFLFTSSTHIPFLLESHFSFWAFFFSVNSENKFYDRVCSAFIRTGTSTSFWDFLDNFRKKKIICTPSQRGDQLKKNVNAMEKSKLNPTLGP